MRWNIKGFDQYEVDEAAAKAPIRQQLSPDPRKATKARKGGHVADAEGGAATTSTPRRN